MPTAQIVRNSTLKMSHLTLSANILSSYVCQGRHLQRGSRLVDFDIRLGDSVCGPVSLTDSQVECRPPTNKPNRNVNNTSCPDDDALSINVCIYTRYITTKLFIL